MNRYASVFDSPVGLITILGDDFAVNEITFSVKKVDGLYENKHTKQAFAELKEYFEGQRTAFSFQLKQTGTDFQQNVWVELCNINFGETLSYLKLSERLKNTLAIRAVAAANGKNKLAIVVPCHRVVGSNGCLVGYRGGLWRKKWLLNHEKNITGIGQTQLIFLAK